MTSKPDFKVTVILLVFMQLTRDLVAIAKFLYTHTNKFFRLAYRSQIWRELMFITRVSDADVPFGSIDDDQLCLGV